MIEHPLERSLEWEPAAEPIVLECGALPVPPFIAGTRKVTVQRDDELRLALLAEGVLANRDELMVRRKASDEIPVGTFMPADEATFDVNGGRCTISAFLREFPDVTISGDGSMRFRHEGRVNRLVRTWTQKFVSVEGQEPTLGPIGEPAWHSDWFVNGPHDPVCMRSTSRRRNIAFSRQREFGGVRTPELHEGDDGRDHFVVGAGAIRFAVCQVPKDVAPEWCRAISIEFRAPIPDAKTRTAIWEIVSVVLGRRLIPIGSTVYDDTGWTIEEEIVNPLRGGGLRDLCSEADIPPVPLRIPSADVEEVLAKLVPPYLELRESMGLRNALWGYWSACEASTPIDLAIFRAAVEALKKGWFASSGGKSDGNYMPKDLFDEVTRDLITTVQERLATHPAAKEIVDNLRRAHRRSGNEEVHAFFAKINLSVGAVERAAMKGANIPAHGGITPDGKMKEWVVHGRAYRTLFARTFLRLLGYDGPYIDLTTQGFPSRSLDVPAGGES